MGRFVAILFTLTMIMLGLHMFGLVQGTPTAMLVQLMLDPTGIKTSDFYIQLTTTLSLVVLAGTFIGFFINRTEAIVSATFITYLLLIFLDCISVYTTLAAHSAFFATILISPLIVLELLLALDYWRGRD